MCGAWFTCSNTSGFINILLNLSLQTTSSEHCYGPRCGWLLFCYIKWKYFCTWVQYLVTNTLWDYCTSPDHFHLSVSQQNREGLLPNISCVSLNYTELVNLEQLPFSAHNLSFFRCQMLKMSSQDGTPELSPWLLQLCQYAQDLEQRLINQTTNRDCNIPQFEQNMDSFIYVRCLLQLLDQKLSSAKF